MQTSSDLRLPEVSEGRVLEKDWAKGTYGGTYYSLGSFISSLLLSSLSLWLLHSPTMGQNNRQGLGEREEKCSSTLERDNLSETHGT